MLGSIRGPVSSRPASPLPALHFNMQMIYLLRRLKRRIIPEEPPVRQFRLSISHFFQKVYLFSGFS